MMSEPPPPVGRNISERAVLRVLWCHPEESLVRREIHRRFNPTHRPTLGRVGQVLKALNGEGLLECTHGRAQGSPNASFYRLSPKGHDLCRQLGFDRRDGTLFPISDDRLDTCLTSHRLGATQRPRGRVLALHAHRGGLGRSTLIAGCAKAIASQFRGKGLRILVIDLDLTEAGLGDYLAPQGLGSCRGLRGLLLDYHQVPAERRSTWLSEALLQPDYVLNPSPKVPNLFFLPNCLTPDLHPLAESEQAAALDRLQGEVTQQVQGKGGFLRDLRDVLASDLFEKTIIDSQAGTSLGAWIATQSLADELIVCARHTEPAPKGLRAVLANFLHRHEEEKEERGGRVHFLFALTRSAVPGKKANRWVQDHIIDPPSEAEQERDESAAEQRRGGWAWNCSFACIPHTPRLEERPTMWNECDVDKAVLNLVEPRASLPADASPRAPRVRIPLMARMMIEKATARIELQDTKLQKDVLKAAIAQLLVSHGLVRSDTREALKLLVDDDTIELAEHIQHQQEKLKESH